MKLGLIGNMNNNNFAMMRYLRDLGADAHLLLYSNDGVGTLRHFRPDSDTWNIRNWSSFIHQTEIPNAPVAAFDFPLSALIDGRSKLRTLMGVEGSSVSAVTRTQVRRAYEGYDLLISSGSTPAVLARMGWALDLYYPYSPGVEFLGASWFNALLAGSWYQRLIYGALRRKQLLGISRVRRVVCCDPESMTILAQSGVPSIQLAVPMVYNREVPPVDPPTAPLARAYRLLAGAGLTILHHARLWWNNREGYSREENLRSTKNSDWLLRAFATLVASRPRSLPRLFIVEYGPDVQATKELVEQLGIQRAVTWLPTMARRELMWLLGRVSVGVGEFMNPPRMLWGGTGWETLASGKPLLQAFRFEEGEFDRIYGYPPPPMLPVLTEEDVLKQLLFLADHPEQATEIGRRAREWFDTYNGIALAKRWLDVATESSVLRETSVSTVS